MAGHGWNASAGVQGFSLTYQYICKCIFTYHYGTV